jgi:phosphoenolpyruvate carboxykinase (GTP)
MPNPEDIELTGLENEVTIDTIKELLSIDKESWGAEVANQTEFFAGFDRLPEEIAAQLTGLKKRLGVS